MAGGGGGFMQAMINSLKDNKNLIGKRSSFAERRKEYLTSYSKLKITNKKATREEIMEVKNKILLQRKAARNKSIIVLAVTVPLIVFTFFYLFKDDKTSTQQNHLTNNHKQIEKYNFHIADGDKMIEQKKWNNAIFQYTRALEIFPKELDAQYRLALAYSYKCINTYEDCKKADSLVDILHQKHTNNIQIKELFKNLNTRELDSIKRGSKTAPNQ